MSLTTSMETGFIGGTPVWSESGLRPIEEIRVGERVWAKPEHGDGDAAYKCVTRVVRHEGQEVIHLGYHAAGEDEELFVTFNHPMWRVGQGWIRAGKLRIGDPLLLASGEQAWTTEVNRVHGSREGAAVGWTFDNTSDCSVFVLGPLTGTRPGFFEDPVTADYRTTGYNLEVDEFHTYYVGNLGVWVHNKTGEPAPRDGAAG
jgi:Pretoxin HINT domain